MTKLKTLLSGADLITKERQRQIEAEDWTPAHDDGWRHEQLAFAAAVYAIPPSLRDGTVMRLFWPWETRWYKPVDVDDARNAGTAFEDEKWRQGRIRTLAKAGALIAAEIDRLQRRGSADEW